MQICNGKTSPQGGVLLLPSNMIKGWIVFFFFRDEIFPPKKFNFSVCWMICLPPFPSQSKNWKNSLVKQCFELSILSSMPTFFSLIYVAFLHLLPLEIWMWFYLQRFVLHFSLLYQLFCILSLICKSANISFQSENGIKKSGKRMDCPELFILSSMPTSFHFDLCSVPTSFTIGDLGVILAPIILFTFQSALSFVLHPQSDL